MADGREKFLKYVLEIPKEINGRDDCENWLNELLLHVDLLGKTVQFLNEIGNISFLDYQDKMERSRKCLFWGRKEVCMSLSWLLLWVHSICIECELPLPTADTKRSGRPAYHITKECLVQLCSFQFSWCKISDMFGVFRWTVCAVFKNMYFLICRNFPTFQKTELTIWLKTSSHAMALPLVNRSCQDTFKLFICMCRETKLEW